MDGKCNKEEIRKILQEIICRVVIGKFGGCFGKYIAKFVCEFIDSVIDNFTDDGKINQEGLENDLGKKLGDLDKRLEGLREWEGGR